MQGFGKGLGMSDISIFAFLAWVALRISLQEPEILHENVTRFPLELMQRFLGHLYFIDFAILEPWEMGWPISRKRKYTSLRHKVKSMGQISPLSTFCKQFFRTCGFTWKEYFWIHKQDFAKRATIYRDNELQVELDASKHRVSSLGNKLDLKYDNVDGLAFFKSLTAAELAYIVGTGGYKDICDDGAWQLNQNPRGPATGLMTSAMHAFMHTLISNCGKIYTQSVKPERWLSSSELLMLQGFPTHPDFLQASEEKVFCSFNNVRDGRSPRHVGLQAGNAMHVTNVGIAELFGYVNIKKVCLNRTFNFLQLLSTPQDPEPEDGGRRKRGAPQHLN